MNTKAVLGNPDLTAIINSYLPRNTKAEIEKFQEDYNDSIDYWSGLLYVFDQGDMLNYPSVKLQAKVEKKIKTIRKFLNVVSRILQLRIEYLAKKSGVKLNDDLFYYDMGELGYYDYNKVGIGNNYKVRKDAGDDLDKLLGIISDNYFSLLKELGVNEKEALKVFNNSKIAKENKIKLPEPEELEE